MTSLLLLRERDLSGEAHAGHARMPTVSRRSVERLGLARVFASHDGCVNAATWTLDGQHVITSGDDLSVKVHHSSQQRVFSFETQHTDNIFDARSMSPQLSEGSAIVTCGRDGSVWAHTLRAEGNVESRRLSRHQNLYSLSVNKLAVVPNSETQFVSAGRDAVVYLYDTRAKTEVLMLHVALRTKSDDSLDMSLSSCAFSPADPTKLLLSGTAAMACVFDLRNIQAGPCNQFAESHVGARSITGAVWNWDGTQIAASYHEGDVFSFQVHGSGASSTRYRQLFEMEITEGQPAWQATEQGLAPVATAPGSGAASRAERAHVRSLKRSYSSAFDAGAAAAAAASPWTSGMTIRNSPLPPAAMLIPRGSGAPNPRAASVSPPYLRRFSGHLNYLTNKGLTFFGDRSEFIVTGCDTGQIFFYCASSGRIVQMLQGDAQGSVNCLSPHPHGLPALVTSGLGHAAKLWQPLRSHPDADIAEEGEGAAAPLPWLLGGKEGGALVDRDRIKIVTEFNARMLLRLQKERPEQGASALEVAQFTSAAGEYSAPDHVIHDVITTFQLGGFETFFEDDDDEEEEEEEEEELNDDDSSSRSPSLSSHSSVATPVPFAPEEEGLELEESEDDDDDNDEDDASSLCLHCGRHHSAEADGAAGDGGDGDDESESGGTSSDSEGSEDDAFGEVSSVVCSRGEGPPIV